MQTKVQNLLAHLAYEIGELESRNYRIRPVNYFVSRHNARRAVRKLRTIESDWLPFNGSNDNAGS